MSELDWDERNQADKNEDEFELLIDSGRRICYYYYLNQIDPSSRIQYISALLREPPEIYELCLGLSDVP